MDDERAQAASKILSPPREDPVPSGIARGQGAAPPQIHRRIVSALLSAVQPLSPALLVTLEGLGIDPELTGEGTIPLATFQRLTRAIAQELSPEDPWNTGLRLAGRAFLQGWARHPSGSVFVDSLRGFSVERALVRLSEGLRFGAEGMQMLVEILGAHRLRVVLRGSRNATSFFFGGCVEGLLEAIGESHANVVAEPGVGGLQTLLVTWAPRAS